MKKDGYDTSYDMVMNLAQSMLSGRSLEAFFNEGRAQEAKKNAQGEGPEDVYPPTKFMIAQFLNRQSVLLRTRVDGEMPMRGRENV
jgi:hypothetical protein